MEKLSNWLRDQRIQSQLDVRELSSKSFVTTAQISRIENNLSGITVNTLVRLGYGLDFGLDEVLSELKIYPHFPRLKNNWMREESDLPIPRIDDAYAIWLFFRDEAQRAKGLMYDGYLQVQSHLGEKDDDTMQKSMDAVWEVLQAHSNKFFPLPYPAGMTEDHSLAIYARDGVFTNRDLGVRLKATRAEKSLSLRELADKTKISYSVLSRLEHGIIERVYFEYILKLDQALEMDGELIALAWAAGEYESGFSLLNYVNEKKMELQKYDYQDWEPVSKAWADTLITICRWHHVLELPSTWWMNIQLKIRFYKN